MNPRRPPHPLKKDLREVGHYAIGTADLIPTSVLGSYHRDLWSSSAQKPMLYYGVGGGVEEHHEDHDMGKGHRRSVAEVKSMDFSNYIKK